MNDLYFVNPRISLCVCAVWSGPLLESKRPDETLRGRGMNLHLCILRMFEDIFSLGYTLQTGMLTHLGRVDSYTQSIWTGPLPTEGVSA